MTDAITHLSSVESRLLQAAGAGIDLAPSAGWLVGLQHDNHHVVTSVLRRNSNMEEKDLQADADGAGSLLPAGLTIIGAYVCSRQDTKPQTEAETLHKQCSAVCRTVSQRLQLTNSPQVWAVVETDSVSWFHSLKSSAVSPVQASKVGQAEQQNTLTQDALAHTDRRWLQATFSCLYLELSVELLLYGLESVTSTSADVATAPTVSLEAAAGAAVSAVIDSTCGSTAAFLATTDQTGTVLLRNSNSQAGPETIDSLGCLPDQAIRITALCSTSPDASAHALQVQYQPVKGGCCSLTRSTLNLSVACYVPKTMLLSELPEKVLKPAIHQQVCAMQHRMTQAGKVQAWTAFQVQPPGWPHLITLMYPLDKPPSPTKPKASSDNGLQQQEDALNALRQQLHQQLGLPANRPLLKFANAMDPAQSLGGPQQPPVSGKAVRLQNVHDGIAAPAVDGGTIHMIDGTYDYHHYMQDKCDDAGWGCAYRSLQTIHSWFRHQHYTKLPVLSLQEIQQTLVDIGDKPQAFVGSRDWIGAIELGYVLDTKLGLTCKVLTVSSGAEMGSKARELAQHFDAQGTPVMIGGGVLAYTLLGISYNEQTGECAFLILDPHYTGEGVISKVQAGQWISWKAPNGRAAAGGPLFVQNAFYNLLCPQRPSTV